MLSFSTMVAAHSTGGGGWPAARGARVLLAALLAVAPLLAFAPAIASASAPARAPAATTAASAQWRGLERRIESAYFQQDAAGLEALSATLTAGAGNAADAADAKDEELRSYYAALIAYRLALLANHEQTRAWPFTAQCVDRLNRVLVRDTGSAEALALQSACLALQSDLDPWRSPLAAPLSLARIDKALKLAPDNPRVLLLGSLAARDRPKLFGGDARQGFEMMRRAVSAFERQTAVTTSLPGWGAADAFTDMAQDYLGLGDTLAARNVLERALLIAPDFAQARRLMAEIVAG